MAKKGLGRGFSTLIPTDILIDDQFDPTLGVDHEISKLQEIPLAKISADPDQPRRHFDRRSRLFRIRLKFTVFFNRLWLFERAKTSKLWLVKGVFELLNWPGSKNPCDYS